MNVLIKAAKIVDTASSHNGEIVDILIEKDKIAAIKKNIKASKHIRIVTYNNLHASAGWFDMQVNFNDPGHEHKEDLLTGAKAAANGGFTAVAVMPSTTPPIHSKTGVEYIKNKTQQLTVDVFPVGAISHNLEGKELAELYDMYRCGAIAFSDDKKPVTNSGLLLKALLYAKNFNGLIITHCDDKSISQDGQMNEGVTSTMLGLKGIPALAEELMVSRNIFLTEYTEGRIHFSNVSTARSVELIREAKAKKLNVTASVNAYHLALDDSLLKDFDTNYKVNPPLRTLVDQEALRKGLADGTLDVIASDHTPQDTESKIVEFDYAANGITALETAFAVANMHKGKLKLEQLITILTINPRKILDLPIVTITEGATANVTLFDPQKNWVLTEKHIYSKSKNSPFLGKALVGKALAIYNNGQLALIAE